MIDITPELLERIKGQFNREYDKSSSIKGVLSKIEKGNATYEDANEYAREIGEILSGALTDNLSSSVLPDGKMYYNIANEIFNDVLGNNYELATNVSASVQQVLNKKSGIGLNAIRPNVDQKRIDGIIDKVSNEDTFDKIKWIVGEPVVNYTQSAVDETIKQNSEFQYKAGLRPKIVRKLGGKCCDWCAKLVGEYSYPDVPKDVYRRHENCRCTVEYINGTKRQNVHTKSYIEEHAEEVRERIKKIEGKQEFKESKTIQEAEEFLSQYVDKNQFGALGVSYAGIKVESANAINKVISEFYDNFEFEKFGGIKAPTPNSKEGKKIEDAVAGYSAIRNSIYLNRNSFKTLKDARMAFEKEKKAFIEITKNPDKYDFSKLSDKAKRVLENSKASGRETYPQTLEESLHHELGHMVERKIKTMDSFADIQSNMLKYAPNISGYACLDVGEYIAESFAAYWNGDSEILDPTIVSVFNSLRKQT